MHCRNEVGHLGTPIPRYQSISAHLAEIDPLKWRRLELFEPEVNRPIPEL